MSDLSYLVGVEQQYQAWLGVAHEDLERKCGYQATYQIALPDSMFWQIVDGPAPVPDDWTDDGFIPDAWACGFVTATGEPIGGANCTNSNCPF